MYYPVVIAHRGASAYALENTMEAFELAVAMGCDYIEFDVRKTKDNVLVIHHDHDIKVNGKIVKINDVSYAELMAIAPYPVATLEDVIATFKTRVKFDIELKEAGYEDFALNSIFSQLSRSDFIITSLIDEAVSAVKTLDPDVKAGLILGLDKPRNLVITRYTELFPWRRLKKCGADFVAPHFMLLNRLFLQTAAREGYPILAWTINGPELVKRLIRQKVRGLISDKPDMAAAIRDGVG